MSHCNLVSTLLESGINLTKDGGEDVCPENIPYQELIGGLMYLCMGTRPHITHAVSYLSQFSSCFRESHWKAAKRVLRYLKGTRDLNLVYSRGSASEPPVMYTDAHWGSCLGDRKSYTGYVILTGGIAVSWGLRKQRSVVLSSTEAEYMTLTDAAKEEITEESQC